jgi:hypothetical protein
MKIKLLFEFGRQVHELEPESMPGFREFSRRSFEEHQWRRSLFYQFQIVLGRLHHVPLKMKLDLKSISEYVKINLDNLLNCALLNSRWFLKAVGVYST